MVSSKNCNGLSSAKTVILDFDKTKKYFNPSVSLLLDEPIRYITQFCRFVFDF